MPRPRVLTRDDAARAAACGTGWSETFVNGSSAAATDTAAAVAKGDSLLLLHGLASPAECEVLRSEASEFARAERDTNDECRSKPPRPLAATPNGKCRSDHSTRLEVSVSEHAPGHVRVRITEMLSPAGQALCDSLLRRALALLEIEHPGLLPELFGATAVGSGGSVTQHAGLVFTPGEPACNVYSEGGEFAPHQDRQARAVLCSSCTPYIPCMARARHRHGIGTAWARHRHGIGTACACQALTVLVTLSSPDGFCGGGTGFWSGAAEVADPWIRVAE